MTLLIDSAIRALCVDADGKALPNAMLEPFIEGEQGNNIISRGLTSAGYDLRLGDRVLVFKNTHNVVIDPKAFKNDPGYQSKVFDRIDGLAAGQPVVIPPHSYILGYTTEYIRMPRNLKGRCTGKSTLARCGIGINTTPIEPGWEGHLTLEIANHTPCPVCVYAGEGVAQLEVETLTGLCQTDYGLKGGKYQRQGAEPVPARVS